MFKNVDFVRIRKKEDDSERECDFKDVKSDGKPWLKRKSMFSQGISNSTNQAKRRPKLTKAEKKKLKVKALNAYQKHRDILAVKTAGEMKLEKSLFGGGEGVRRALQARSGPNVAKDEEIEEQRLSGIEKSDSETDAESEGESGVEEDSSILESLRHGANESDDEGGSSSGSEEDEEGTFEEEAKKTRGINVKKPAWVDEDDETTRVKDVVANYSRGKHPHVENLTGSYKKFMEKKFSSVFGSTPKWATVPSKTKQAEDDPMLMKTGVYVKSDSESLPSTEIRIKACADLNAAGAVEGSIIMNVEFHPWSQVALVAGKQRVVTLYQVDGKDNPKVQSVWFENMKMDLKDARFSADGNELVVGFAHQYRFCVYDMMAGATKVINLGRSHPAASFKKLAVCPKNRFIVARNADHNELLFLSAKTKETIGSVHLSDPVDSFVFTPDGEHIIATGEGGLMHIVDTRSRVVSNRLQDAGSLMGTALAVSPCGSYVATGNSSGVVNVYESSSILKAESGAEPQPVKTIMNLVTSITSLEFNHSSEILAFGSSEKRDHLRLFHTRSRTTFQNFPAMDSHLARVTSMNFSLNSGFFALGNNVGRVKLFRLRHYNKY